MIVEVSLRINSRNAAFGDSDLAARAEVVRILGEAQAAVDRGRDSFPLKDVNGNNVGDLFVTVAADETNTARRS